MPGRGTPAKSIKRQSKSCKRCLKRKQRCHGFPVCSGCEEAKKPCEQSEYALQLHSRDSSYAAFKRIQTLEAQLASALDELSALRQGQPPLVQSTRDFLLDYQNQATQEHGQLQMPLIFSDGCTSFHNATDYTRSSDDAIVQSHASPVGGSSGSTAATLGDSAGPLLRGTEVDYGMVPVVPHESTMEQMVQATIWTKALSSVGDTVSAPISQPDPQGRRVQPPADGMGRRMLQTYFEKIHPRYPFLEQSELFDLHARRYDSVTSTALDRFNAYKLNMVYAIGGTLLKLTNPYAKTQAEGFLANALQHVSSVRESHPLHTIEGIALLVLYNLRSQFNTGIWFAIGLAMRTCIDLGLHLESSYTAGSPFQNQKKRRLFWSVYLLERIIALSLRRPLSIAEHDIETRLPSEIEKHPGTNLSMWVKLIQIKRFESRIQSEVYCANETRQQRFAKIQPLLAALDAWNQSFPPLAESEVSYLQLQWNKAVSQLLRPFLSMMHGDNPLISRCLKASGHVCDIFKRMHQRETYSHSFVSAHSTFIAGVTMCYCLFLAPSLFNNSVANSLRACSSTMFVIAERTHELRKHRDILEDIIGRIIDSPAGPGLNQDDFNNPQAQQCSQLDFIAVQSLLNLAAQQEPQDISELNNRQQTDARQPEGLIALQPTDQSVGPGSFLPAQPLATDQVPSSTINLSNSTRKLQRTPAPDLIEKAPEFSFHGSWEVDRYSLEMLDRMTALESRY